MMSSDTANSQVRSTGSASDVTLLVCTRNCARRLRRTLQAIGRLDPGAGVLREVLVVDNGSTDATPHVIRDAQRDNPRVRGVEEPTAGHNRAYNTGVAAAAGDYVLFTDDDTRPPVDWVLRMHERMVAGDLDALAGGVGLDERYARAIRAAGLWSIRDWFAVTTGLPPDQPGYTVGANMMFRRSVLQSVGPFLPELGPGAMGFCGDTEYFTRVQKCGCRVGYAYDLQVEHRFDLTRLRWSNLKKMAVSRGRSAGYVAWHVLGERVPTPSWWQWLIHDLPRRAVLPILHGFWPGAAARRAHLIRRRAAMATNREERRRPPRRLVEGEGPLAWEAINTSDGSLPIAERPW